MSTFNYEHCVKVDGGEARPVANFTGARCTVLASSDADGNYPVRMEDGRYAVAHGTNLRNLTEPPRPMPKELAVWVEREVGADGVVRVSKGIAPNHERYNAREFATLVDRPNSERHLIRPGTLDPQVLWDEHRIEISPCDNGWAWMIASPKPLVSGECARHPTYTDALRAASAYAREKASKA